MKIEFELSDNEFITKTQLSLITKKILKDIKFEKSSKDTFVNMMYHKVKLDDVGKYLKFGERVEEGRDMFYTLRKTKSGIYKVKVWGN